MKRYQKTALPQYFLVFLIIMILMGMGFLSKISMERVPFLDYFALPWAAGRSWLLEDRNPYDLSVKNFANRSISESGFLAILPDNETLQQPMINLILFLPFSLLPYKLARIIWMTLLTCAVVLTCYLSLRMVRWKSSNLEKLGMITLSLVWLPNFLGILTGQLTVFVMLFSILCIYLIASEKDTTAGFLMALMVGSLPQSIFLLIFLIIWAISKRRWPILTAFISGTAFLFVVTILLLPSWLIDWIRSIFDLIEDLTWVQTPLMQVASFLPGIEQFLVIFLHIAFGLFLLVIWIRSAKKSGKVLIWNAASVLVVTFLMQIRIDNSLQVSLLLGLMLIFSFWIERWGVIGKVLSWGTMLAVSAGSWLPYLSGVDFTQDISAPYLTIGLPLLVLLSLLWIRWWVVKIPKLNNEF